MATSVSDKQKNRQRLVIEYWYRTVMDDSSISISDIIGIILDYADDFEMLKFSKEWMSAGAFTLKYDNTMAIKTIKWNKWIMPDIEPITEGKVCWRINVK